MKLRLRGNSLRLRLTRSEVAALAAGDVVGERTAVAPGRALSWCLQSDPESTGIGADYRDDRLVVTVPAELAGRWAGSEAVSLEAVQPLPGDEELRILVEKDFACLAERPGEDDSDAFPHPAAD